MSNARLTVYYDSNKRIVTKASTARCTTYCTVDTYTRFNVYSFRLMANRYIYKSSSLMGYRSHFSMRRSFLSNYVHRDEERWLGLCYDMSNDDMLNWKYF